MKSMFTKDHPFNSKFPKLIRVGDLVYVDDVTLN